MRDRHRPFTPSLYNGLDEVCRTPPRPAYPSPNVKTSVQRNKAKGGAKPQGVRLQRLLARAGVAARRTCEEWIEDGRVKVNGQVVRSLPCFVTPGKDKITVDGKPVFKPDKRVYVLFNKPARVLVTTQDEPGADRQTIASLVKHPSGARLYPVGRLEYDATGLVLLTNDGDLTHRLTHPRYGVARRYEATVSGPVSPELLRQLERDLAKAEKKKAKQAGRPGQGARVRLVALGGEGGPGGRGVVGIELRDGTATQIASVLHSGGLSVKKLERISLGPLELSGVARGRWRDLDRHEIRALKAAVRDGGMGGVGSVGGVGGADARDAEDDDDQ